MDNIIHYNINIDQLEVGEWLGSGAQESAVFKGVWHCYNGTAIEVAIKKIQLWKYSSQESAHVFREINIMQTLPRASNICRLYGTCIVVTDQGKEVWVVMEYADGGDLHSFMSKYNGPLPQEIQRDFLLQASIALQVLHDRPDPILHRDIKSFNFLVQTKNNKLLLADFGISKPVSLTNPKTFTVGTLRWVAPEIIKHKTKKYWTEKSDIFSLGMVFYEILTQNLPYSEIEDDNINVLLAKVKRGVLPKLPEDCPKHLAALITKCWKYKPESRPHINEVIQQLEMTFADSPVPGPSSKPTEPTRQKAFSSAGVAESVLLEEKLKKEKFALELNQKLTVRSNSAPPRIRGRGSEQTKGTIPRSFSTEIHDTEFFFTRLHKKIFGSKKDKRKAAESPRKAMDPTSSANTEAEDGVRDEIK